MNDLDNLETKSLPENLNTMTLPEKFELLKTMLTPKQGSLLNHALSLDVPYAFNHLNGAIGWEMPQMDLIIDILEHENTPYIIGGVLDYFETMRDIELDTIVAKEIEEAKRARPLWKKVLFIGC